MQTTVPNTQPEVSPWAQGAAVFAGVIMMVGGAFQAIQAFAAIVNDQYLVVLPNYVFALDVTVWGWIHLFIGLGLVAVGVFVLRGENWARVAGIVVAAASAVLNFFWLPYSPWWALLIIGIDVLVIWALASYLRHPAPQPMRQAQSRPAPPESPVTR
ncbi:MAG TPA: hypothetical protein VE462_12455 [Propionibacteriaceae bacterium]|nr:hypothetical protein [Propionibacteriaceae bacterium]